MNGAVVHPDNSIASNRRQFDGLEPNRVYYFTVQVGSCGSCLPHC